jgi:hypothetical protein
MIESEFRDWMRSQLRSLDERLRRLDREVKEPRPKAPLEARWKGEIDQLWATVTRKVKDGQVRGLAVAFVDGDEVARTGYAAQGGYFALAGAATLVGLEILEDYRKAEDAANDQFAASAEADPAVAQG